MISFADDADLGFPLHEKRRAVIESLIDWQALADTQPGFVMPDLHEVAAGLGWQCARTVQRWMAAGGYAPQERERYEIDPAGLRALLRTRGRVMPAYRLLEREQWLDGAPVTYETFRAAFKRVRKAWRAAMKHGDAARRDCELDIFVGRELLFEVLALDGKEMSIIALHPRTGADTNIYVIAVICETSRVIAYLHVTPDPIGTDDIIAALVGAMLPSPEFPYAGRPHAVRWDNHLAHVSVGITNALSPFGIPAFHTEYHAPWQNPYAESLNNVFENSVAVAQPTFKHGPTFRDRTPVNGRAERPDFEVVKRLLIAAAHEHNTKRVHSSLGCTPDAEWTRRPKPPVIEPDRVRWMVSRVPQDDRTVTRKGIRVLNEHYVHPALYELMGRAVWPYRRNGQEAYSIDVFDVRGKRICTAINRKDAPDGLWIEIQDQHYRDRREFRAHDRAALKEADDVTKRLNAATAPPLPHATPEGRRDAIAAAEITAARTGRSRATDRTVGDHSRDAKAAS